MQDVPTICIVCEKGLDLSQDTYVAFSRSVQENPCSHYAHLMCTSEHECSSCPVCSSKAPSIDFGLLRSHARFSALSAMKLKLVATDNSLLSKWMGNSSNKEMLKKCFVKYPFETLQQTSILQFIEGGVTVHDLLNHLTADKIHKHLSCHDILQLSPCAEDLASLMKGNVFNFAAGDLSEICNSVEELSTLKLSPSNYIHKGFGLDQWISRGAELLDILNLHRGDVRFSEFVATWNPTVQHLTVLQCFDSEYINEHTKWKDTTIRSYANSLHSESLLTTRVFPRSEQKVEQKLNLIRLAF